MKNNLLIAKFPSKNDTIDKAAWEYLTYNLALKAGIEMAKSQILKISGNYNTFLTKRFDRAKRKRIHLRNHGFLLSKKGWRLSPAYDINPSIDKYGLALNIDMDNNALDFDLAKSVGEFFMLRIDQMDEIIEQVKSVIKNWRSTASEIGISRQEQELMESAFQF